MRKGERVKLNEEITEKIIEIATNVPPDHLLDYYLASYLPIISDSLASIADSLEILTKEIEDKETNEL